jgi:hypothetical protein
MAAFSIGLSVCCAAGQSVEPGEIYSPGFGSPLPASPPVWSLHTAINAQTTPDLAAKKIWELLLTKCGESYYYYVYEPVTLLDGTKVNDRGRGFLHEFRGIAFKLLPEPVSPAERLNGVQWKGHTYIEVTASRELEVKKRGPSVSFLQYSEPIATTNGPVWSNIKWSDKGGENVGESVSMTKVNNKWVFQRVTTPGLGVEFDPEIIARDKLSCAVAADPAKSASKPANQAMTVSPSVPFVEISKDQYDHAKEALINNQALLLTLQGMAWRLCGNDRTISLKAGTYYTFYLRDPTDPKSLVTIQPNPGESYQPVTLSPSPFIEMTKEQYDKVKSSTITPTIVSRAARAQQLAATRAAVSEVEAFADKLGENIGTQTLPAGTPFTPDLRYPADYTNVYVVASRNGKLYALPVKLADGRYGMIPDDQYPQRHCLASGLVVKLQDGRYGMIPDSEYRNTRTNR